MSHVPLWEDDHLGVAIETPAPAKGRSPSAAASFQPPQRVAVSGDTGDLRITVSAFPSGNQPPRKPSLLLHSAASRAAGGARWAISKVCTICVLRRSSRDQIVDSCMVSRGGTSCSQPPTPVPFFPEVHEELTGTWKAPFTARNRAVGPPPSPPLMAVRLRVTRASPLWNGPWLCSCALTPPGAGSRLSLPGPVSTRRTLPAGLTRPGGKPLPPYMLWRCCRSIRPRH